MLQKLLKGIFILLLGFSQNLFATTTTFTFDSGDDGLSTITKTVDGLTITLSNPTSSQFASDAQGVYILDNNPSPIMNGLNISFSKAVKFISYNVGYTSYGEMDITYSNGGSESVEHSPFSTGSRNFANQMSVDEGSIIGVSINDIASNNYHQTLNLVVEWGDSLIQTTTSGVVFATQPEVEAIDEYGNIDTDYAGEVTLTKNGLGTLGGTVAKTAVSGVIVYDDLKYTATADNETYTLTATSGSVSGTSVNIISEVIATKLLFTTQPSPTSIEINIETAFSTVPVVKAVDADGTVDTDFAESVTLSSLDGTFINGVVTASNGVATFTGLKLNYDTAETFKLVATANSLTVNSTDLTATPDSTAPTISSITIPNSSMKIGSVVTVTITVPSDTDNYTTGSGAISGTVGGFALGSFTKTNDTSYTATFTVTNGGTDVASGSNIPVSIKLTDSAGNQMTTAFATSIIQSSDSIDANAPTLSSVMIASNNANTTKAKVGDEIIVTFIANETISTPTVTIAGKSATVTNTSGNIHTAKYTMLTGDTTGGVTFTINFSDSATNAGTRVVNTTNSSSVLFDKTAPTIVIRTNDSSLKAGEVATLTFTLSENSTNFALADITVTGGILSNFAGSGISYTVDFTPTASSNVGATVNVASSKFTDTTGNLNTVATQLAMSVDTIVPTIAITSSHSSLKAGEVATLTFTLSENSTNFALADITVTGGTIASFTGSGNVYTVSFTPTASSTTGATVNVVANKFTNIAGNGNSVAPQITMSVDTLVPTLTSTSPVDNATGVSTTTNIVLTMSENVSAGTGNIIIYDSTNTQIESIPINDAKVTISGTTVTINPSTSLALNTLHYVKIASGILVDASGNAYAGISDTTSWNFTTIADTTAPTISSLAIPNSSMKIGSVVTVTITVPSDTNNYTTGSGAISGTVGGFALGSFSKTNDTTYTTTFTVTNGGTDVASGTDIPVSIKLTDSIGNQMATAFTTSITQSSDSIDANTPTLSSVTIVSNNADTTKSKVGDEITVTFTANETVALPTVTIAGKNATVTNTSGNIYTAKYTMVTGDTTGVVPFTINFSDSIGNVGTQVTGVTDSSVVTLDTTAPTGYSVSFTTDPVNSTNKTAVAFSFAGAEMGTTYSYSIDDNNGSTSTITGTATISSATEAITAIDVSSLDDGTLTLTATLTDPTGNEGTSVSDTVVKDVRLPVITQTTAVATLTKNNRPDYIFNTIENGTLTVGGSCGTSTSTTLTVGAVTVMLTQTDNSTALADGTYSNCTIMVTNMNGNPSNILAIPSFTVDTTAPTAIFNPVNNANHPIDNNITITFSELIKNSDDSEITDANITSLITLKKTNASGDNIVFTAIIDTTKKVITIDPTDSLIEGQVYYLSYGNVSDGVGNLRASENITFTAQPDTRAPTVVSFLPEDGNSSSPIDTNLTIIFDENIQVGTGNIVIKYDTNDSVVETIDVTASRITISNNRVTIDPTEKLNFNTKYYVSIDIGAIKDIASTPNAYVGVSVKGDWDFTTVKDITPNEFSFTSLTNQNRSTLLESNEVNITGIDDGINISIVGGEYKINSGSWTDVNGTINNDDNVTLKLTSSGSYSSNTIASLTIGSVTKNFDVRTKSVPPPIIELPVDNPPSNDIRVDETTAKFDENIDVEIEESGDSTKATIKKDDKIIELEVDDRGTMSGKIESHDKDGNLVTSSVKIELTKSKSEIDAEGNIHTTVKTKNDSTIKVGLNIDGSVQHVVESKNGVSIITSAILGSKVEIDKDGNVEITAEVEKNGFIYKAVITTDTKGQTQTKFVTINVATGEEKDIQSTLKSTTPYEAGIKSEIIEIENLIYIKTTAPLSGRLIIE